MEKEAKLIVDPSVNPFEKDEFQNYLSQLETLRADGESKIDALKMEIRDLKLNKQIEDEDRVRLISDDKDAIEAAKIVANEKRKEVNETMGKAVAEAKVMGKAYYEAVCKIENKNILDAKSAYKEDKKKVIADHMERLKVIEKPKVSQEDLEAAKEKIEKNFQLTEAKINAKTGVSPELIQKQHSRNELWRKNALAGVEKKVIKNARDEYSTHQKAEKILYKSELEEIRSIYLGKLQKAKDNKFNAYLDYYGYISRVRNNKPTFLDNMEYKFRNYTYSFDLKNWLLKNALYLIAVALFVIFIIVKPDLIGNPFHIVSILSQSSTRLFYSLGVAGLILIAGTDLSIGRMTGMGVMLACLFTSRDVYTVSSKTFGTLTLDMTNLPLGAGILLAIIVPIILCVLFSSIAGFFTAKFKMHPFITTLSTQLLIYGFLMISIGSVSSFNMVNSLSLSITGGTNGTLLIIYAAIATAIVWFIWNKTKFGKNMYAVGGNPEAAKVSGINVFSTIMCIFVMAGVLYGFGGFFEAARTPVGTAATGYGSELNAIAACVIGGVSFNGGIGKISGVVVGTIIFQGLTYCLTVLGIDTNMQFIFQGAIIMAAVCLDSLKYLKKK